MDAIHVVLAWMLYMWYWHGRLTCDIGMSTLHVETEVDALHVKTGMDDLRVVLAWGYTCGTCLSGLYVRTDKDSLYVTLKKELMAPTPTNSQNEGFWSVWVVGNAIIKDLPVCMDGHSHT